MERVRVDKWLWAARCYRTRSKASAACSGGHVQVNGVGAKAARMLQVGDRVELRQPDGWPRILEVVALSDKRGPARVAQELYTDLSPERPPRPEPPVGRERGLGRPTKRDRRLIRSFLETD